MNTITPSDVARFLNGEVTDRHELEKIIQAIETDPQVQAWYDQLDLDSLLPDDDDEHLPDIESPPPIADRAAQIARSQLCTFHTEVPLKELVSEVDVIRGRVVAPFTEGNGLEATLRRTGDEPPTFELSVPDWPADQQPLAILLGNFEYADREAATHTLSLRQQVTRRSDDLLAEGTVEVGHVDLAALSPSHAPTGSADITMTLDELQDNLLHVIAKVPADRNGDVLVAELHYTDAAGNPAVQRRGVPLDRRVEEGRWKGYWKGSTSFGHLDDLGSRKAMLTVRSLTDADLYLLPQPDVVPFLASQPFLSMPIEPTESGFRFRARWADQQTAAGDARTCWCLQVAPVEGASSHV